MLNKNHSLEETKKQNLTWTQERSMKLSLNHKDKTNWHRTKGDTDYIYTHGEMRTR